MPPFSTNTTTFAQGVVRAGHARAVSSLGGTLTSPLGMGILGGSLLSDGVGNLMGNQKLGAKRATVEETAQKQQLASVIGGGGTGSAILNVT